MEVINIISLQRREDRVLSIVKQSKETKVVFRFWEGIEHEGVTTAQNINASHKQIVRWAKEQNLRCVIIAEDDCILSSPQSFDYFISQMPIAFDLFFGMLYAGQINGNRVINGFSGMTLYACHRSFYEEFLAIPDHVHIDRWLGQLCHEKKYIVCQPYVCLQSGGYSDNLKKEMHYGAFTDSMEFYGQEGNVFRRGEWIPKDSVA